MSLALDFDFDFSKILGWSVSRYNMFQTCKRQYYYNYYGKYDNKYPYSEIKKLKNLNLKYRVKTK